MYHFIDHGAGFNIERLVMFIWIYLHVKDILYYGPEVKVTIGNMNLKSSH